MKTPFDEDVFNLGHDNAINNEVQVEFLTPEEVCNLVDNMLVDKNASAQNNQVSVHLPYGELDVYAMGAKVWDMYSPADRLLWVMKYPGIKVSESRKEQLEQELQMRLELDDMLFMGVFLSRTNKGELLLKGILELDEDVLAQSMEHDIRAFADISRTIYKLIQLS